MPPTHVSLLLNNCCNSPPFQYYFIHIQRARVFFLLIGSGWGTLYTGLHSELNHRNETPTCTCLPYSDARDCFFLDDNLLHVIGIALGGVPAYLVSKKLKGVHDAFQIRKEMTQTTGFSNACVGGPNETCFENDE